MSRSNSLGGVFAGLAAGVVLGALLGGRMVEGDVPAGSGPSSAARRPEAPAPDETEQLRELLVDRENELDRLRGEFQQLHTGASGAKTPEQNLKTAEDLHASFLRIARTGNTDDRLALLGRSHELNPDLAPWFIDRYRRTRDEEHSRVALELALRCGGKDVSAFVQEMLTGTLYTERQRMFLLSAVDGVSPVEPAAPFPVDEPLLRLAEQLSRSEKVWERKGAAGLLGRSPGAGAALRKMAESDPDPGAKAAALRALGRTGDPSHRPFLKALQADWSKPAPDGKPVPGQTEVLRAIHASLRQLNQK